MRASLQSFWVYHWWDFLNNLDGEYNDPLTDRLFANFIWKPLSQSPSAELPYGDVDRLWKANGYAIAYGSLTSFLDEYCRLVCVAASAVPPQQRHTKRPGNARPAGEGAGARGVGWGGVGGSGRTPGRSSGTSGRSPPGDGEIRSRRNLEGQILVQQKCAKFCRGI